MLGGSFGDEIPDHLAFLKAEMAHHAFSTEEEECEFPSSKTIREIYVICSIILLKGVFKKF
jgi:hypothetical protein